MMRNFENWETQDVEMTFGIDQKKKLPLLEEWLSSVEQINSNEQRILDIWRDKLLYNADFWNEDELKLQFIAPLLNLIDYTLPFCKPFSQRKLVATINGIKIGGWIDYMLASGKQKPIRPYFFFCTNINKKPKKVLQTQKDNYWQKCSLLDILMIINFQYMAAM